MSTAMPELHRRKLQALAGVMAAMGVIAPNYGPLGETLTGLPNHAPKIAVNGIPVRLLPEQAMGCAGCGQ